MSAIGERRRCLCQKRGFADTGIAADQKRGTTHETAAGNAVKLADAGNDARRILYVAGERGEGDGASLALGQHGAGPGADAAIGAFLDERVPLAAGVALACPARMDRAAILANELNARLGHQTRSIANVSLFILFREIRTLGQVCKSRELGLESELDRAGWPVTLLGDNDVGSATHFFKVLLPFFIFRVKLVARLEILDVIFLAEHEQNHVGVLFDGARFTKVGKLRALVVAA